MQHPIPAQQLSPLSISIANQRRRLPPTPTRRCSSPRMLPTPPPERCPSAAALLERRSSGRRLPMAPTDFSTSTDWPSHSPPISRQLSDDKLPLSSSVTATGEDKVPVLRVLDFGGCGTPSSVTTAESRSSSLSPSIEHLTTTESDHETAAQSHGLDPALYVENAPLYRDGALSSSVPEMAASASISSTSSWPEGEPRPTGLGLVHCSLQHFPVRKRLRLSILRAEGLGGPVKPELEVHAFFRVCLMPGKQGRQTSIVKRGRDAVFNQEFFFDQIGPEDLETKSLQILVYHQSGQKLQKDVVIGDIIVPLKEIAELHNKKEVRLVEELRPRFDTKKLGKLQISTCLEKDARRLTINLIKADDLPKWGITGAPDVCIRITLVQGSTTQTKQSRVLKNTCSAVYKEAVMFLIATGSNDLQETKITISAHDLARTATGDDLIGSAFLGTLAIDKSELEQWRNTIEHSGKEYKSCHHLKLPNRPPQVHVGEAQSDSE